jgi:hypothetical protein
LLAVDGEALLGRPLLQTVMRSRRPDLHDSLADLRERAAAELRSLPRSAPCAVVLSGRLARLTAEVQGIADAASLAQPLAQHSPT